MRQPKYGFLTLRLCAGVIKSHSQNAMQKDQNEHPKIYTHNTALVWERDGMRERDYGHTYEKNLESILF